MAEKDRRLQIFEDFPIPKAVFALVAPSIAGMVVMLLYNMADTFFVGMLNDARQTAAVTLAAPVMLAFNAVNNLFGVGASSLMGRSLGKKEYDTAAKTSAFGIWGAIAAGLLFSLLIAVLRDPLMKLLGTAEDNWEFTRNYMLYTCLLGAMPSIVNFVLSSLIRTEGSSMQASMGMVGGCLLNMILDPFFILPRFLNMGVAGAGLATLISNVLTCVYFFIFIIRKGDKSFVCIDPKKAIPNRYVFKEVFSVGIPASIQNLLNVTGMTILNNFASPFGSTAVSAFGISHKVCMFPLFISMGLASGANPIVSYNYGSKNYARAKACVKFTTVIGLAFAAAIMVWFYLTPGFIIGLFMKDPEIIEYGSAFIRAGCFGMMFMAMDFIGVGVYQSFGKGKLALFFALARKIILEIPALFILNKLYPLYGLAYAQPFSETVLGIAAAIVLVKMFRKLDAAGKAGI